MRSPFPFDSCFSDRCFFPVASLGNACPWSIRPAVGSPAAGPGHARRRARKRMDRLFQSKVRTAPRKSRPSGRGLAIRQPGRIDARPDKGSSVSHRLHGYERGSFLKDQPW
jgi:hypothetical protein